MSPFRSLEALFCASFISVMLVLSVRASDQQPEDSVLIGGGGIPVNIRCANQPGNPAFGDCYEVYAETLREIPFALRIGLGSRQTQVATPLNAEGNRWYDFFKVTVKDNPQLDIIMQVIPGTERISLAERLANMDHRMSDDIPALLQPKDGVSALARITDADGEPLTPGVYHFIGSSFPGAEDFFGAKVAVRFDFSVTVKAREPGDDNAYLEERIERHYLWGTSLQLRDMKQSKQVLENGLALVKQYINSGTADNDGAYNLSPRFQAAALLTRLDRKREAITFLQRALSKGAGSDNCAWQPYHFGLTTDGKHHGKLPFVARDRMYRRLSRLYLEVYGRPLGADMPQGEE